MVKGAKKVKAAKDPLADKIYQLCDFIEDFRDLAKPESNRRYCFVLGAGASLSSEIMSGRELATNWLKELYIRKHPGAKETDVQEDQVRKWATPEILGIKNFTYDNRANFYGNLYALRFRTDPSLGQQYLRNVIDGKKPSFGYTVLAQILAGTDHRVVITTNFDHLTEEALQRYMGVEPHVVGDEELAHYISQEHSRPAIAKIHGDIFRKTYNANKDISKLKKQWETPLRAILKNYTPIFIGYGGNDPGFMEFLTNEDGADWLAEGFIWTYRPQTGIPKNELIRNFVSKHRGRLVPIPGFDEFFLLLNEVFQFGKLDKKIEQDNADRLNNYRQAFNKIIIQLRDNADFQDADHYPALVKNIITNLAGPEAARGWWDWVVEANKESHPDNALKIYEKAIKILPDSPQLLGTFTLFLAQNNPSYPDASEIGIRALEKAKTVYGPEHPVTLECSNNLGMLYQSKGMYDKALPIYEETLAIRLRVLGAEHPNTLTSRNNLASLYQDKGEYDKALPIYEETLAIRLRVLGAEHPNTLASRNNLAMLHQAKGEYDRALPLYEETLAISQRVLGAEHPDSLQSSNNLAVLYKTKGEYDKALPLYEETLAIRQRVLGTEHPNTLTSRNNLAMLYRAKGEYDKALPLLEDNLAIIQRVLGTAHPNTLASLNNLTILYQSKGEHDKALPLIEETLATRQRVLGAEHPNTLTSRNNLAMLYQAKGEYDKALPLLEETLAISQRVLGSEHPDTLLYKTNLEWCRKQSEKQPKQKRK